MKISKQLQSGEKFNRLTVLKLNHIQEYISPNDVISNKGFYLCKCDCGNECIILKQNLKLGYTKSCGCLQKEKARINGLNTKTHGLTNTRLYKVLQNMKSRCYDKNSINYGRYGYHAIIICDEWLDKDNGFINFYNWSIANGYQDNLTIDRINSNGNYEPSNCHWATYKEQNRNRRNNRLITYNRETHCIAEWSEILGINISTLHNRIKRPHLSIKKAFETPVKIKN